jgi:hypothetical protein
VLVECRALFSNFGRDAEPYLGTFSTKYDVIPRTLIGRPKGYSLLTFTLNCLRNQNIKIYSALTFSVSHVELIYATNASSRFPSTVGEQETDNGPGIAHVKESSPFQGSTQ